MQEVITMTGPSSVRVNGKMTELEGKPIKQALEYLAKIKPNEFRETDIDYNIISYQQKIKGKWVTVFKQFM